MSAVPKKVQLTETEYLRIERGAFEKSDFYRGEMFAMAGASRFHCTINTNIVGELHGRLQGTSCRQFANDMRVKNELTGLFNYPDCLIVCEEPKYLDRHEDVLLNPRVIIEIVSPSTESYDRGFKFQSYRRLPSCQEYIMVSQRAPLIERYVRQADDTWLLTIFEGLERVFSFSSVPIQIPMKALYQLIDFTESNEPGP